MTHSPGPKELLRLTGCEFRPSVGLLKRQDQPTDEWLHIILSKLDEKTENLKNVPYWSEWHYIPETGHHTMARREPKDIDICEEKDPCKTPCKCKDLGK